MLEIDGLKRCTDQRDTTSAHAIALPLLTQPRPPIRKSRAAPWRAAVLIGIHVLFLIHIAHWLATGSTITPVEPSESMEFSKHNVINVGLILFVGAILSTAILGRFFCGWACHMVAVQDVCSWLLKRAGIRPKPMKSRWLLWVPLIAAFYMFIWPLVYRAWLFVDHTIDHAQAGNALGKALALAWNEPHVFPAVELTLTTENFWATFPGLGVSVITILACGFGVVYLLGAKGYCTYGCPYGAFFALADKVAPGRIRVTDACEGCGHCTAVCTSNVRVHEEVRDFGMVVDPGCMKCMDCVSVCPKEALYFGFGGLPAAARGKGRNAEKPKVAAARTQWGDYSRVEEAILVAGAVAGFAAFRGLYDLVPFLFSLGLAAMTGYLTVQSLRLITKPNLTMHGLALKRRRVTPLGWVFAASMTLLGAFVAHSGAVQFQQSRGEEWFAETAASRTGILRAGYSPTEAAPEARTAMEQSRQALRWVERWELVDQSSVNVRLAYLARALGDDADFEARLRRAIVDLPLDAGVRADLGDYLAISGKPVDARLMYQDAIRLAPTEERGPLTLGLSLSQEQRFEEARAVFDAAVERIPGSPDLWYAAGVAAAELNDPEAALGRFSRAAELRPGFLAARDNLVSISLALGRVEEAVRHAEEIVKIDGETIDRVRFLAQASLQLQRWDAAERHLARVVALEPADAQAWAARAQLAQQRGDQEAARRFMDAAREAAAAQPAPK